jgi:excisionase family DNA binding protein
MVMTEPRLLTVEEAAKRLGMGRSFVYELVLKGELGSVRLGRARRIPVEAVDAFVDRLIAESADSQA